MAVVEFFETAQGGFISFSSALSVMVLQRYYQPVGEAEQGAPRNMVADYGLGAWRCMRGEFHVDRCHSQWG